VGLPVHSHAVLGTRAFSICWVVSPIQVRKDVRRGLRNQEDQLGQTRNIRQRMLGVEGAGNASLEGIGGNCLTKGVDIDIASGSRGSVSLGMAYGQMDLENHLRFCRVNPRLAR